MATKSNVLLLIKSLGLGGAERLLVDSLPYLDRARFVYHVAYLVPWKAMLVPQIVAAGIPVSCLGDLPGARTVERLQTGNPLPPQVTAPRSLQAAFSLPLSYWRLHTLQRQHRFDLIHADMPLAGILARLAGRQHGIPVIYTEHNLIERYHPLTRRMHEATFGWQECVLTVSDEVQSSIRRAGGDRKTTVRTLLNGVPVDQVRGEAVGLADLRAELAIPAEHRIVGSVAVFRSQKRLADWLAVAAQVAQQEVNVTFLLVGDGPEMPVVQKRVRELGLSERIRLPGFRADGRRCIGLMDIYLMTSQFEGLPIALLEAMTLGKPIVSTAVGGIPEVITGGQEGWLAPVGAITQLAQQLKTLLDNAAQRQAMGERGAAKVEAAYHIKQRVHAIEEVYKEVLQKRHQPQNTQPLVGEPL
ncbi:MAG: glycosyltransferase [Caldilineaceae bacterium]|nr:glycosyltransferase [Caldilineaceae bacterium]